MTAPTSTMRRIETGLRSRFTPDLPEAEIESTMTAVFMGTRLKSHTNGNDGDLREVCLTAYINPGDGCTRYAVEVWSGTSKNTVDFATLDEAEDHTVQAADRLGL